MTINSWGKEIRPSDFFGNMGECRYQARGWVEYHKPNHKMKVDYYAEFTILRECRGCGKCSTPKKVKEWYLSTGQYWGKGSPKCMYQMLCWSCYNKVKPLENKYWEAHGMKRLINKTKREISKHVCKTGGGV